MSKQSNQWLVPVLLALGVAGALWYYRMQVEVPAPIDVPVNDVPAEAVVPPIGPQHPIESTREPEAESPILVPLPALDESDEYFKIGIVDLFGAELEARLAESGLIERFVATIDSLPRASVAERVRPLRPIGGFFMVDGQDESGEFSIASANGNRYVELIAMLDGADLDETVDFYRRFYPLFQKAYQELGYPNGYFNDRLVEVVDHLLETPQVEGPIELVRPNVLYEFRDPQLEALSSGQKLLLRLGSENAAVVRRRLSDLRSRITSL